MSGATPVGAGAWGQRRLVAVLGAATLFAAVLLAGLGYAIYYALGAAPANPNLGSLGSSDHQTSALSGAATSPSGHGGQGGHGGQAAGGAARRDAIAARPMLAVDPAAGRGGIPAAAPARRIAVPGPTGIGPARVPTGFPHTPAGALGQLAAIETSVLSAMSLPHTREVHRGWALPGPPTIGSWRLTTNVRAFLASAGAAGQAAGAATGQVKDPTVTVTPTPVAAQIKGVDGHSWVLACVLLDVRAVIITSARIAYGYCERMQWSNNPTTLGRGTVRRGTDTDAGTGVGNRAAGGADGAGGPDGRWMIAPGPAPAAAPSTWPGTALAARAGWRTCLGSGPIGTPPVGAPPVGSGEG